MPRTMVVLPVPGPPVTTITLRETLALTAWRWLSAKAMPIFRSAHPAANLGIDPGQRVEDH